MRGPQVRRNVSDADHRLLAKDQESRRLGDVGQIGSNDVDHDHLVSHPTLLRHGKLARNLEGLTSELQIKMLQQAQEAASRATQENPACAIRDLITNLRYGAGLVAEDVIHQPTFEMVRDKCIELGYLFSFALTRQKPVVDWIDFIRAHARIYLFPSKGKIKFGIWQDEPATFAITVANIVVRDKKKPPLVNVKPRDYNDSLNRLRITFTDASKNYDVGTAIANDGVDQVISGRVREETIDYNGISTGALATKIAYRELFTSLYRMDFLDCELGYENVGLEVGDVGTINDGGSVNKKIRIVSIGEEETSKKLRIIVVEDRAFLYREVNIDTESNEHIEDTLATLAEPTVVLLEQASSASVGIICIPVNQTSFDNPSFHIYSSWELTGNYTHQASYNEGNAAGTLTQSMPAYPVTVWRPDDTIFVDVGAFGVLTSASDNEFFNYGSLCRVEDEIIAYKTAERQGATNVFKLTGLIRGIGNTEPVAHGIASGSVADFVSLDNPAPFAISIADIGKTIYFKILSYSGEDSQELDDVTAVSHKITGEFRKPANASLVRINGREGFTDYSGDATIDWYLASRDTGFNISAFNDELGIPWVWGDDEEDLLANDFPLWGDYVADPDLQTVILRAEETDGTLIVEKRLLPTDEQELLEFVADLNSKDPAVIKVTPATTLQATVKSQITIDRA